MSAIHLKDTCSWCGNKVGKSGFHLKLRMDFCSSKCMAEYLVTIKRNLDLVIKSTEVIRNAK